MIKRFSLAGMVLPVELYSVYDGDTISIMFKPFTKYLTLVNNKLTEVDCEKTYISCRMVGYNSAEIRGASDEEKEVAKKAKNYLMSLLADGNLIAEFHDFDKYGRPLVDIYKINQDEKIHINKKMINSGYGIAYLGKGEKVWK